MELVLDLFPGLGALGLAFEMEGYAVVSGPDLIWGRDVRGFHLPYGSFSGLVAGTPCQPFSRMRHLVAANGYAPRHEDMIPEFERLVAEAAPRWFLMENVEAAPIPRVKDYAVTTVLVNNRDVPSEPGAALGPEQNRVRRFSFGVYKDDPRPLILEEASPNPSWEAAVAGDGRATPVKIGGSGKVKVTSAAPRRTIADMLRLQGLPEDFLDESPLTETGKRKLIGNCVPIPLGRAVARAVRRAMQPDGTG